MNKIASIFLMTFLWVNIAWAAQTETVMSVADSGAGSLREAISNVAPGGTIDVNLPAGSKIVLASALPVITKNLTLNGNGVTLTSDITPSASSQLLSVSGTGVTVTVNRIYFLNGKTENNGGAIYNNAGTLTFNSCIFKGNETTGLNSRGGAIYNYGGNLIVNGCTFYENKTAGYGGAIYNYFTGASLRLTGNLFFGNTAINGQSVFNSNGGNGTLISGGYNVYSGNNYGFTFDGNGDLAITDNPVSPVSFRPIGSKAAAGTIADLSVLGDYPTTDFYGAELPAINANIGAVQGIASGAGYILDYSVNIPGAGVVNIVAGAIDADGYASGNVSLEAQSGTGYVFQHWLVNGVESGTSAVLQLSMTENKTVQAVFRLTAHLVTSTADNGAGSFRAAIENAQTGDLVLFDNRLSGQTVALSSTISIATGKTITIEGNGAIITSTIPVNTNSQMLIINSASAAVTINRLHFANGKAQSNGGAIRVTDGKLTLNSCIFSGNQTTNTNGNGGGVIHNNGTLYINGCTFYNNTSKFRGGAIYNLYQSNKGNTYLTGCLFYGNTAVSGNIGYNSQGSHIISYGYNVYDNTSYNFTFNGTGDTNIAGTSDPVLSERSLRLLPGSPAAGVVQPSSLTSYPTTDFYGDAIPVAGAAAGAVQQIAVFATITFDWQYDGIAPAVQTETLLPASSVPADATRPGCTFAGWYRDAECTTPWNFATDIVAGDMTLYAKWTLVVSFNSNGGSPVASQVVQYGKTASEPSAPALTGYTFNGWYGDVELQSPWDFSGNVITQDTTLYAGWTINTYLVTFVSNGGGEVEAQTIEYGAKIIEPATPVRENYTFAGWFREEGLLNQWNFSTHTVTRNISLYAKWRLNTFTVTFESNGGSEVASQTVEYGKNVTEPAPPVLEGFTFSGWYKDAELLDAWNFAGDLITHDTTLYAKWEPAVGISYAEFEFIRIYTDKELVVSGLKGDETISVLDMSGRIQTIRKAGGKEMRIDRQSLPVGVAFIRIEKDNQVKTFKIAYK